MNGMSLRPELGENVLMVMDNCPACLAILRMVASSLPKVDHRYFTLLHCCPTIYWEHGGDADAAAMREMDAVWQAEEDEFNVTEQYFARARRILEDVGVPAAHIRAVAAVKEDSLAAATIAEVRRGHYSGVIISRDHADIVNRLLGRGLTDIFRRIPKVAVWAIDSETFAALENQ
jgi:hypothetical protein